MVHPALRVTCLLLLLGAETVHFGQAFVGSILRLAGERAFFRSDLSTALVHYERARAWGPDRRRLETDLAELYLFGLDQHEAGSRAPLPVTPPEAVARTRALLGSLVIASPSKAYYWSLASDAYGHLAILRRRETVLDLEHLSEDPLENVSPEQWLALAALVVASRLEPNNYLYHDLLSESFLEMGSAEAAAPHCRAAVAARPDLDDHSYLTRPGVPAPLVEAALKGFEAARAGGSMVADTEILCDSGRLLLQHGQAARALPFLREAVRAQPDHFVGRYFLGQIHYVQKEYPQAIAQLTEAARLRPNDPMTAYALGLAYREAGNLPAAIDALTRAREGDPQEIGFFHALGETLERVGRLPEAERQFVAAASVHPDSATAWSSLLRFYLRHDAGGSAADACAGLLRLASVDSDARAHCARLAGDLP